jgi:multidrug resistance protein, MATE family
VHLRDSSVFSSKAERKPRGKEAEFMHVKTENWRSELSAMFALAWPLILANLTMTLISATDVYLLGQLSKKALAASALGLNLQMAFSIAMLGFASTAAPLIAAELGRRFNSVRDVRRTFRQACWAVVTVVLPIWVILWQTESIMLAFGQDPELSKGAGEFIHGYQWSMLPFLLFQVMRNFLAALERPGWVLAVSLTGIGLNYLISGALTFGWFGLPRLELFGAGLGSSIVWALMAVALALVLMREKQFRRFHLFGRFWRADWARYRSIFKLGFPIALMLGFEAGVFSCAVWLIGQFGEDAVAAHTISLQIASMSFMVPMGIAQAATVRVGLGFGRQDDAAIARAGQVAFVLGVGFMTIMAVLLLIFPRALIGFFIDAANPENAPVFAIATGYLLIAAAFQIVDGAQVVLSGMLRGLQDTTVPMIMAGVGYWGIGIGVGSLLAFTYRFEGMGIWTGLAVGLAIVATLLMSRWIMRGRLGLMVQKN